MKDDLENVKNLGTSLMLEMSKITSDFRIGEDFLCLLFFFYYYYCKITHLHSIYGYIANSKFSILNIILPGYIPHSPQLVGTAPNIKG